MPTSQAQIPSNLRNLWRVAGWLDEHEHAIKLCRALGYEKDEAGDDMVRVEFVEDLFEPGEALIHPHMLLPA